MLQTFEARLKGNQLEWVDEKPLQAYKTSYPIDVYITFREKIPVEK
jgi:hypothetical protein